MANFARIIDGVAVDVSHDPENHFHADLAAEFVSVPDDVQPQWRLIDSVWTAPEVIAPTPPVVVMKTKLTRVEFKMQFTQSERLAIKMARAYAGTDAAQIGLKMALDDFYELLEDPGLTEVDLTHPEVVGGVNGLVAATLLTSDRAATILAGIPQ